MKKTYSYFDRKEKKWKQGSLSQQKYALWEFHNYLHDGWLANIEKWNIAIVKENV